MRSDALPWRSPFVLRFTADWCREYFRLVHGLPVLFCCGQCRQFFDPNLLHDDFRVIFGQALFRIAVWRDFPFCFTTICTN
jgi:hypothetical protein